MITDEDRAAAQDFLNSAGAGYTDEQVAQAFAAHRELGARQEREAVDRLLTAKARESLNGHVIEGVRLAIASGKHRP